MAVYASNSSDYPRNATLSELFERQVDRAPEGVALLDGRAQISYGELDSRANRLAHLLREKGVSQGAVVALILPRGVEFVVSVIAVLKAGGTYLPLDPRFPANRLEFLLTDAGVNVAISTSAASPEFGGWVGVVIRSDVESNELAELSSSRLGPTCSSTDPAYIMYTSGSTGEPKGVVIPHRAIVHLVFGQDYAEFDENQTYLLLAPTSFDASTFEIWAPLLHGSRLAIHEASAVDLPALEKTIRDSSVTCVWLTAALFNTIIDSRPQTLHGLKHILTGGEALSVPHVCKAFELLPGVRITNGYGPTESTTFACTYAIPRHLSRDAESVPIGRPISHTSVFLMDAGMSSVPDGEVGELCIGGDGLAIGYLNSPDLTNEKFVQANTGAATAERVYRTGDRVRRRPDGLLEFLGRVDDQVKIRGHRVEPGETQSLVLKHPDVSQCIVLPQGDAAERCLVAYVVILPESGCTPAELRAFLGARLPSYMVPKHICLVDELPLSVNGKVDRSRLPVIESRASTTSRDPIDFERSLEAMWKEVTSAEVVRSDDRFLEIGGDSLRAMAVVSRIEDLWDVQVPVTSLLKSSTFSEWAAEVQIIRALNRRRPRPRIAAEDDLSPNESAFWHFERLHPDTGVYNIGFSIHVVGEIDARTVQDSLDAVLRRHPALRTKIVPDKHGNPTRIINEAGRVPLQVIECSAAKAGDRKRIIEEYARDLASAPIRLNSPILLRSLLIQFGHHEHAVVCVMHHVSSDAQSLKILVSELLDFWNAKPAAHAPVVDPDHGLRAMSGAVELRAGMEATPRRQLQYWSTQLAGFSGLLDIKPDRPRPDRRTFPGNRVSVSIGGDEYRALVGWAKSARITLFSAILSAVFRVLMDRSHSDDVVVGVPVSRRRTSDGHFAVGCFVNTIPIRITRENGVTAAGLAQQVHETLLRGIENADVPLAMILDHTQCAHVPNRSPIFQAVVSPYEALGNHSGLQGAEYSCSLIDNGLAPYELSLFVEQSDDGVDLNLQYNVDLFVRDTAVDVVNRVRRYVVALATDDIASCDAVENRMYQGLNSSVSACCALSTPMPADRLNTVKISIARDESMNLLRQIWKRVLRVNTIGDDDDFFELGGHSLKAAAVVAAVEKELKAVVPVDAVFQAPTLRKFMERVLQGESEAEQCSVIRIQNSESDAALVCFPGHRGHALNFRELASKVGKSYAVFAVNYESLHRSPTSNGCLVNMARRVVDDLHRCIPAGPWTLVGFSLGGSLAWEVARLLDQQNQQPELLILLDAYAPSVMRGFTFRARAFQILRRLIAGRIGWGTVGRKLVKSALRTQDVRHEIDVAVQAAWQKYVPQEYSGQVALINSTDSFLSAFRHSAGAMNGWAGLACGECTEHMVDSEHLEMLKAPGVDRVAELVGRLTSAVYVGSTKTKTHRIEVADIGPTTDDPTNLLRQIWKKVLGVNAISDDDDFFELGGQSLKAAAVVAAVKSELKAIVPVCAVYQAPTLRRFRERVLREESRTDQSSIIRIQQSEADASFICFPGYGGHALNFRELAGKVGESYAVYAVTYWGMQNSTAEDGNLETMARRIVDDLDRCVSAGPWTLIGYSLGGSVAWEVARLLDQRNRQPELLILLDAYAPSVMRGFTFRACAIRKLRRMIAGQVGWSSGARSLVERAFRNQQVRDKSDLAVKAAWQKYVPTEYSGRIALINSTDPQISELRHYTGAMNGWAGLACGRCTEYTVEGGHLEMLKAPGVDRVAELVGRLTRAECVGSINANWD